MRVLGMLSGTSYDGVDVAAAQFHQGDDGVLDMTLLGELSTPMAGELRRTITSVLPPASTTLETVARLDVALGEAFADAAVRAKDELCSGDIDVVCCPGQTVFHWVQDGQARGSLQLGRSTIIAERTGAPVVFDLYNRDIACGGQGAPLTAMLDRLLLAGMDGPRATLNIGGIANIGVVAGDGTLHVYDVGPGNALLDAAVSAWSSGDRSYDEDGRLAAAGKPNQRLLSLLLEEPFYRQAPPKSTGKELFHFAYLREKLERVGTVSREDIAATLTALTATVIAEECRRWDVQYVIGSGGGMLNPVLVKMLRQALAPARLVTAEDVGLPVTAVESYCIALLGFLTASGVEATIPSATGGSRPSLMGSMTPGMTPPRFEQVRQAPQQLRIRREVAS